MNAPAFSWPSPRHDEWRWTPLGRLNEATFAPPEPGTALSMAPASGLRVVIGPYGLDDSLSTPDALKAAGVTLRTGLAHPAEGNSPIHAFMDGLPVCGLEIDIGPQASPPPIEIVWHMGQDAGSPLLAHDLRLNLGAGAVVTVIERTISTLDVPALVVQRRHEQIAAGAQLNRLIIEERGNSRRLLSSGTARLAQGGAMNDVLLTQGGRLTRHERHVHLEGDHTRVNLCGVMMPGGENHAHLLTYMHHHAPHSQSRQTFRSVAADKAQAAFQGRICVDHGAAGADASQSHKGLLLNPGAAIHTRPELEINADDVRCAHGAAVGALDADALFYLRARGIPLTEARRLLVDAFAMEALEGIDAALPVAALSRATLRSWMGWSLVEEDA